ncbi:MAG: Ig-like domain-containing protein [Geminicoccaceae bacterium]
MATLTGTSAANTLVGGTANDVLFGRGGNDTLTGGNGSDSLLGEDGNDSLFGGNGADRLFGGAGNDSLAAGNGNDSLEGGAGNDSLDGGLGNDTLLGQDGSDRLQGGNGNDNILAGNAADTVFASDGNDRIDGGAGNDSLSGGDSADTITGGTGNDSIDGGAGNDVLVLAGNRSTYTVTDLGGGVFRIVDGNTTADGNDGSDRFAGIETVRFKDQTVAVGSLVGGNGAPVAVDDTLTVATEDDPPLGIAFADLLANDRDPNNDTLTITAVGNAVGGTVSIVGGQIVFDTTDDFFGTAAFDYTVSDGKGGTDVGRVSYQVDPVEDTPVALDDVLTGQAEGAAPRTITFAALLANDSDADSDPLDVFFVNSIDGGTAEIVDGKVVFTADPDFAGTAKFQYGVLDPQGNAAVAYATFAITPVNDDPAADDDVLAPQDEDAAPREIAVAALLDNDRDADNDPLDITAVGNATGGTVRLEDGKVVFTATANFNGTAGFDYTVSDGNGGTDTASVSFNVVAQPDNPVAAADTIADIDEDSGATTIAAEDLLANDQDPDNGTLTIYGVNSGTGGFVSLVDGDVVFTPSTNYSGPAEFTYFIRNESFYTASATVTFTVTSVNDAPVAVDYNGGPQAENAAPRSFGFAELIGTAFDIEGDPLTVSAVGNAAGGSVAIVDGEVVFTATANFSGTAGFDFTVSDGNGGTDVARASFTITDTADDPVAGDDSLAAVAEDSGDRIIAAATLLDNDSDPDGQTPFITDVGSAVGGTALLVGTDVRFVLAENFNGEASFVYTIDDGTGRTDTATVRFDVTPVNDAPVATDDSLAAVDEDSAPRQVTFAQLTGNDSDAESDPLTVSAVDNATGGTVAIADGKVVFTLDADFNGEAGFDYTVSDGKGGTDIGRASFTVNSVPDQPDAADDTLDARDEDFGSRTISFAELKANDTHGDGRPLTLTAVGGAVGGTVVLDDGKIIFTAEDDFNGTASFDYTIVDDAGGSDSATVSFVVDPVNDDPVAFDDLLDDYAGGSPPLGIAFGALTGNDEDVDEDPLTVSAVDNAVGGTAAIVGGEVVFTLAEGFLGRASFDYTVDDGNGGTDTGHASFRVTGENRAPVAVDDSLSAVDEDSADRIITFASLTGNDSDANEDPLTVTAVDNAVGGTAVIDDGRIVFILYEDFHGTASFDYTVSDGTESDVGEVTFAVNPVNDEPVAGSDFRTIGESDVVTGNILANDEDADNDTLFITRVNGVDVEFGTPITLASGAVLTLEANGDYTFDTNGAFEDLDPGESAFEDITYVIKDGNGGTSEGLLSFDIEGAFDVASFKLGFSGWRPGFGQGLWIYDGTTVTAQTPGGNYQTAPEYLTAAGDKLYYSANVPVSIPGGSTANIELWKYDGTSHSLIEINLNNSGLNPNATPLDITAVGETIYLSAFDGSDRELWKYDGTSATEIEIRSGAFSSSNPKDLVAVGSNLFFRANDGSGETTWKYDGTTLTKGAAYPDLAPVIDGARYVVQSTPETGNELVRIAGGSSTVIETAAGAASGDPRDLTVVGDTLYFTASNGTERELWKYDGSTATEIDTWTGGEGDPQNLVAIGSSLWFTATDGDQSVLFEYDGSALHRVDGVVNDLFGFDIDLIFLEEFTPFDVVYR